MEFRILTTTHKRPELLKRAVLSVSEQEYKNYKHIIVNDSPEYDYSDIETALEKDPNIIYFKNKENIGKNASLNFALDYLEKESFDGYIIFLDDDDWLSECALKELANHLEKNNVGWLVTERVVGNTSPPRAPEKGYNYFKDYLLGKKIVGDKTHIINIKNIAGSRFSKKIKNGEEWFFFIGIPSVFEYKNFNTTLSDGYMDTGLNNAVQDNYIKNTFALIPEIKSLKMLVYLLLRVLLIPKKIFNI
jgi:glycosyltransferase involved in cell wall biosynthesis